GRNVYPPDVEATVERLDPAFRPSGCAVFSLEDDAAAQMVIVQEVESRKDPRIDALPGAIRAAVAEQHEVLSIAAILLVKAGHIPRTTSGKIQRARCKSLYLANALDPIWSWKKTTPAELLSAAPEGEIEIAIAAAWQDLLGCERVGRHDDFFKTGGHSLLGVQLIARLREELGLNITLHDLFATPTPSGLAQRIAAATALVLPPISAADRTQSLPLSWAQQRLWFLAQLHPAASLAYHMPAALQLRGSLDRAALQATLNRIVARHEILRTTFIKTADGTPVQVIGSPDIDFALSHHDLTSLRQDERDLAVAR